MPGQCWDVSETATRLHHDALVWDGHAGFAYVDPSDLDELNRWRSSSINVLSFNATYDVQPWYTTIECLSKCRHWVRAHSDTVIQVETVNDIPRAKRENKLAVAFDIEGMNALNGDVGMTVTSGRALTDDGRAQHPPHQRRGLEIRSSQDQLRL